MIDFFYKSFPLSVFKMAVGKQIRKVGQEESDGQG